uniref:LNR domain-containing protein n=1 Tax=Angiostrongylus cantonensis TaxID=6313 RepID=A0A158PAC1_ANGCA
KQRGPPNRKQEPLTFDNNCNEDPWIIKQRSTVTCETKCFKWQQLLNNSGSFSVMTLRGCYNRIFDIMNPTTIPVPDNNFCSWGEVRAHLTCLSDASVIEHSCWCDGDFCNAGSTTSLFRSTVVSILLLNIF